MKIEGQSVRQFYPAGFLHLKNERYGAQICHRQGRRERGGGGSALSWECRD